MRNNIQLYINDQLVDLFDFEDINIVDSIQDVRDISKVFVPYSREFTVPASKNNNKIFKHYYNSDIVDSFDARFKVSAVLKINGQIYKKGRITLNGTSLKNNKAYSYKLVFYSRTIDLKTIIGDDLMSELNNGSSFLNQYNLPFTYLEVSNAINYGYNLTSGALQHTTPFPVDDVNAPKDLIIPFISTSSHYFYDSNLSGVGPIEGDTQSRNIRQDATPPASAPWGIYWKDLRPSLRLPIIINAIEDRYGINFTGNFFSTSNPEFNRLYMWLNADKGIYGDEKTIIKELSDYTLRVGSTELRPLYTTGNFYRIDLKVTPDDVYDEYNVIIRNKDNNTSLLNESGKGTQTFSKSLTSSPYGVRLYDLEIEVNGVQSISVNFEMKVTNFSGGLQYVSYYDYAEVGDNVFNIAEQMPKIKVLDFLTGLFKMFNLTAYTDENDNIVIDTLDEYYLNGNTVDITKFVDTEIIDVKKNTLYSQIDFAFEDTQTFAAINSNIATNDEFGNERIKNTEEDSDLQKILAFEGGSYEVAPKFEKMQFERMTNQDSGVLTNYSWGWCVDENQSETLTNPILHYAHNVDISTEYNIGFDYGNPTRATMSYYYRPSNSLSTASTHGQSLNFGSEYDEYYFDLGGNEVSLFNVYWKNTILAIYDKQSRIITLKGNLPSHYINTIKLNDTLVIRGKKFRINKLDVSITTGKTSFELVTYREIIPYKGLTVDTNNYKADTNLITVDKIR